MKWLVIGNFVFILSAFAGYLGMQTVDQKLLANKAILSDQIESFPESVTTPAPTFIPRPNVSSQEINGFIERFAAQYGVDPNILRHIAVCESGFNPNAINRSYAGLYQFSASSWRKYRAEMGENTDSQLRLSAEEAVQTSAFILSTKRSYIWPNCTP